MSAKNDDTTDESNTSHRRDTKAVAKRINRAFDEFFHIESNGSDDEYTVFSGSGNTYTVNVSDGSCTCPDGQRGSWCKHAHTVLFQTGELPSVVGSGVVPTESDDEPANDEASGDTEDAGETLTERVERFEAQNPGTTVIEVISQLGINPEQKDRVEEILN